MGIGNGGGNNVAGFFGLPKSGEFPRCGRCGNRKPDVSPHGSPVCEECKGAIAEETPRLISDAAEASETFGDDALEDYARDYTCVRCHNLGDTPTVRGMCSACRHSVED